MNKETLFCEVVLLKSWVRIVFVNCPVECIIVQEVVSEVIPKRFAKEPVVRCLVKYRVTSHMPGTLKFDGTTIEKFLRHNACFVQNKVVNVVTISPGGENRRGVHA